MTIKAGILARVSTDGQKDNSSHDAQLERCRTYCVDKGYRIVLEKREIMSGSFVLARTDFNALLDADLDVIVVDIPDRLGRGDAIAQCEMLARLNHKRVEYAQPGRDTSTIEGYIQHSAEQMVSGIERHNITRRTKGGKRDWAEKGRVIAPPRRPYGYRIVRSFDGNGRKTDCVLEIDEPEAAIVRRIYDMYTRDGLTTGKIARRLTDDGTPRMADYDPDHKALREAIGGVLSGWPRSTVGVILRNPLYKGEWQYGRRKYTRTDTPDGVKVQVHKSTEPAAIVPVPAIVTEQQWDLAQLYLAKNKQKFSRPTNLIYPLRGLILCALCGSKFYALANHGNRYYQCYRHGHDYRHDPAKCPAGSIKAERLEQSVWETLCKELRHPARLRAGLTLRNNQKVAARRVVEQSLAALDVQVADQRAKLDRWLELVGKGLLTTEKYAEKKQQVDNEIGRLAASRQPLRDQLSNLSILTDDQLATLWAFQREIASRLRPDVSLERQAALLGLLDVQIVFNHQTLELNLVSVFGSRMLSISSR